MANKRLSINPLNQTSLRPEDIEAEYSAYQQDPNRYAGGNKVLSGLQNIENFAFGAGKRPFKLIASGLENLAQLGANMQGIEAEYKGFLDPAVDKVNKLTGLSNENLVTGTNQQAQDVGGGAFDIALSMTLGNYINKGIPLGQLQKAGTGWRGALQQAGRVAQREGLRSFPFAGIRQGIELAETGKFNPEEAVKDIGTDMLLSGVLNLAGSGVNAIRRGIGNLDEVGSINYGAKIGPKDRTLIQKQYEYVQDALSQQDFERARKYASVLPDKDKKSVIDYINKYDPNYVKKTNFIQNPDGKFAGSRKVDDIAEQVGDYVYHATPNSNIQSISEKGLTPNTIGNRTYFSPDELGTKGSWNKPDSVLLRIKKGAVNTSDAYGDGKVLESIGQTVNPKDIEIKIGNEWKPLKQTNNIAEQVGKTYYHGSPGDSLSVSPDGVFLSPGSTSGKRYSRGYTLKPGGDGTIFKVSTTEDLNVFDFNNPKHRKALKDVVSEQEFDSYLKASRGGYLDWSSSPDTEVLQELGFDGVKLFERPKGMQVFDSFGRAKPLEEDVISTLVFDPKKVKIISRETAYKNLKGKK